MIPWMVAASLALLTQVVDLNGHAVDPLKAGPGVVANVLVFTTTDCPISNRYAPEITRLADAFRGRGVRFSLVYPVPTDSVALIKQHLSAFAYRLPAVRDTGQELVKLTGVSVTPEVAVLDARGRLVYRGRIDDRWVDFGRDRPAPTTHDLEDALDAVAGGRPVAVTETRAVGCFLSDLLK
ncbi:MAG: redoxin family protein [Vicinamibacterales bacterium]